MATVLASGNASIGSLQITWLRKGVQGVQGVRGVQGAVAAKTTGFQKECLAKKPLNVPPCTPRTPCTPFGKLGPPVTLQMDVTTYQNTKYLAFLILLLGTLEDLR